jgi:hypothetical protein
VDVERHPGSKPRHEILDLLSLDPYLAFQRKGLSNNQNTDLFFIEELLQTLLEPLSWMCVVKTKRRGKDLAWIGKSQTDPFCAVINSKCAHGIGLWTRPFPKGKGKAAFFR